jgi:hypothetical protein
MNQYSRVKYLPWNNLGGFQYNEYTLTSLARRFEEIDGAAFLFWGTDKTWWRGQAHDSPRDNVVFEAGLAIGTLGLERTAIVTDAATKLPSDLLGINLIMHTLSGDQDMDASILHDMLERFFGRLSASRQLLRSLWSARHYRIFFHCFDNAEPGEFEEIVNLNAVRAIGLLTEYFARDGITSTLHSSRSQDLMVDDNLIVLGSIASNRLTARLLAEVRRPLPFECVFDEKTRAERRVVSAVTKKEYYSRFDGNNLRLEYAILTKLPNPYRKHTEVIVASGNYGFGTLAAVKCAVSDDILAGESYNYDRPFQAIIEVPVLGFFTLGEPRIMEFADLSGSFLI